MNSLKDLTTRTRKSLSGLLSGYNDEGPTSSGAAENTIPRSPTTRFENDAAGLEEFGTIAKDYWSPSKDSPSKRHRLLGSLRTIGSMRSLRSGNIKSADEASPLSLARVQFEGTPIKRERRPIALEFEESPFHCFTGTEIENIRHHAVALPIAKPERDSAIDSPGLSAFTVGSVMDSPAPIKKKLDREDSFHSRFVSLNPKLMDGVVPTPPVFSPMMECPLPTPMPGTNLPMEDAAIPAPNGRNSSEKPGAKRQDEVPGYFDLMPINNSDDIADKPSILDHGSDFMVEPNRIDSPGPYKPDAFFRPKFSMTGLSEFDCSQQHPSQVTAARDLKPDDKEDAMIANRDNEPLNLDDESREALAAKRQMCLAVLTHETEPLSSSYDKHSLERRLSAWARYNALYNSTGYSDIGEALQESPLEVMTISGTIRDGTVDKDMRFTTPLPESHIYDEDTIDLAQGIIFDALDEGKPKDKSEDQLIFEPDKKPWLKYRADAGKKVAARPSRNYTDDQVEDILARGNSKCPWPLTDVADSPFHEAAALHDLIRTYGAQWYEEDLLEAQAQAHQLMDLFPKNKVVASDEIKKVEKRAGKAEIARMITEMNDKLADIMPVGTRQDAQEKKDTRKKADGDMTNKRYGDARETRPNDFRHHLCEKDIEACGEPTNEMESGGRIQANE